MGLNSQSLSDLLILLANFCKLNEDDWQSFKLFNNFNNLLEDVILQI